MQLLQPLPITSTILKFVSTHTNHPIDLIASQFIYNYVTDKDSSILTNLK